MATILNNLAGHYYAMGQYERALPLHQRAFRILLRRTDTPAELAQVASNLGFSYQKREKLGPAIFYYKLAVNASQQLRAGAKGLEPDLQRALTKKVEAPYPALAEVLIQDGRLVEAEQVLAMLKEQEQFEFVRRDPTSDPRQTRATLSSTEQALADRLGENAQALAALYAELEAFEKRNGSSAEDEYTREQLRERLAMESERFDGLLKDVEQQLTEQTKGDRARELATLSTSAGTVRDVLSELHEATGARPAVVYFLPSENTTTFLVITKDGAFAIHGGLGEQPLNERVKALRDAIAQRSASYRQDAEQLYKALITPIEPQLKTAQVDMVMLYLTDVLRYLPFAALYDAADHKHLVEKYSLSLYTAAAQGSLKDHPTLTWSAAALGLSKSQPGFNPLPSVVQELKGIVRDAKTQSSRGIMTGSRYLDETFTRRQFMRLLGGDGHYPVLHVATHFNLAPGNDADSFLVMGNGETLTLHEIRTDQGIKLRGYDLVTLSACETAVGGGSRGVEVEGLGVTIQNKGAKSVLATLWKVQDAGTARFMEEFYRARGEERKVTKAEALRQAQLSLLQGRVKTDNPKIDLSHPYYWAPFVLMGNWK
jgi:CHAT domain-containing protein